MGKVGVSLVVVACGLAMISIAGQRWNARGGIFDPLPALDVNHEGKGKLAIVTGANTGLGKEGMSSSLHTFNMSHAFAN